MPQVRFTHHLRRYFPDLESLTVDDAATVADVISAVNDRHPGLADYVLDDHGAVRKHVNIFVGGRVITDRTTLSDSVGNADEVCIMQALSGG